MTSQSYPFIFAILLLEVRSQHLMRLQFISFKREKFKLDAIVLIQSTHGCCPSGACCPLLLYIYSRYIYSRYIVRRSTLFPGLRSPRVHSHTLRQHARLRMRRCPRRYNGPRSGGWPRGRRSCYCCHSHRSTQRRRRQDRGPGGSKRLQERALHPGSDHLLSALTRLLYAPARNYCNGCA